MRYGEGEGEVMYEIWGGRGREVMYEIWGERGGGHVWRERGRSCMR